MVPALNVFGLPNGSDFIDLLNGLQCVLCKSSIISLWPITLPFKLEGCVLKTEQRMRRLKKHADLFLSQLLNLSIQ